MRIIIRSPIEIEIVEGKRESIASLLPLALPFLTSLMRTDAHEKCDCPVCDAPDDAPDVAPPVAPPGVTPNA